MMASSPLSTYELLHTTSHVISAKRPECLVWLCSQPQFAWWLSIHLSVFDAAAQYQSALDWLNPNHELSQIRDLAEFLRRNGHILGTQPRLFWQEAYNRSSAAWLRASAQEHISALPSAWLKDRSLVWKPTNDADERLPTAPPRLRLQGGWETISLSFSPDGQSLYAGDKDGFGRRWATATGRRLHLFNPREDEDDSYTQVIPSPDGRHYCIHDWWGMFVFEAKSQLIVMHREFVHDGTSGEMAEAVASCHAFVENAGSWMDSYQGPLPKLMTAVACTEAFVITLHEGGYLARFPMASYHPDRMIALEHMSFGDQLSAKGSDRFTLISGGRRQHFDARTMAACSEPVELPWGPSGTYIISPQEEYVAYLPKHSMNSTEVFSLHRLTEEAQLEPLNFQCEAQVVAAAFLDDERLVLATVDTDHTILIYDLTAKQVTSRFSAGGSPPLMMATHSASQMLAVAVSDGSILLWRISQEATVETAMERAMPALAVTTNGNGLAAVTTAEGVFLLKLDSATPVQSFPASKGQQCSPSASLEFQAIYGKASQVSVYRSKDAALLLKCPVTSIAACAWGNFVFALMDTEGTLHLAHAGLRMSDSQSLISPERQNEKVHLRVSESDENILISLPGDYLLLDLRRESSVASEPSVRLGLFEFQAVDRLCHYAIMKTGPQMIFAGKVATIDDSRTPLLVYDLRASAPTGELEGSGGFTNVVFSRKRAAALTANLESLVWNEIPSGRLLSHVATYPRTTVYLALSAQETLALTYTLDHFIRVWDLAQGRLLAMHFAGAGCEHLQFLDEHHILYRDANSFIRIFEIQTRP